MIDEVCACLCVCACVCLRVCAFARVVTSSEVHGSQAGVLGLVCPFGPCSMPCCQNCFMMLSCHRLEICTMTLGIHRLACTR